MRKKGQRGIRRLITRQGSVLLEAMIGTAILAIVMTFFSTTMVSGLLLMQRAHNEVQASEKLFVQIENHKYDASGTNGVEKPRISVAPVASAESLFELVDVSEAGAGANYRISYVAADGTSGYIANYSGEVKLFSTDLYAYSYASSSSDQYKARFSIFKGKD